MFKEQWEKYKGKIAIAAVALIIGLPAVGGVTGLGVISKEDGKICIGTEAAAPAPVSPTE